MHGGCAVHGLLETHQEPGQERKHHGHQQLQPGFPGAEPGRHRPGDGGDGEHTAEHPDAGNGPLPRRSDPHPVHQQAAEGLPRHGGHREEGDAEQSHGEGLGEDEEGPDAAGQHVVRRKLPFAHGGQDPRQPGPALGQAREMTVMTTSPVLKLTTAAPIPSSSATPRAPLIRPWIGMNNPVATAMGRPDDQRETAVCGS